MIHSSNNCLFTNTSLQAVLISLWAHLWCMHSSQLIDYGSPLRCKFRISLQSPWYASGYRIITFRRMCIHPPLSTSESLNQCLWKWYVYHGIWAHLSGILYNLSYRAVCLYVCAKQRLGESVTPATNTHATVEELLDVSFSMWSVSYQRRIGD
jgi:hypothetical protein